MTTGNTGHTCPDMLLNQRELQPASLEHLQCRPCPSCPQSLPPRHTNRPPTCVASTIGGQSGQVASATSQGSSRQESHPQSRSADEAAAAAFERDFGYPIRVSTPANASLRFSSQAGPRSNLEPPASPDTRSPDVQVVRTPGAEQGPAADTSLQPFSPWTDFPQPTTPERGHISSASPSTTAERPRQVEPLASLRVGVTSSSVSAHVRAWPPLPGDVRESSPAASLALDAEGLTASAEPTPQASRLALPSLWPTGEGPSDARATLASTHASVPVATRGGQSEGAQHPTWGGADGALSGVWAWGGSAVSAAAEAVRHGLARSGAIASAPLFPADQPAVGAETGRAVLHGASALRGELDVAAAHLPRAGSDAAALEAALAEAGRAADGADVDAAAPEAFPEHASTLAQAMWVVAPVTSWARDSCRCCGSGATAFHRASGSGAGNVGSCPQSCCRCIARLCGNLTGGRARQGPILVAALACLAVAWLVWVLLGPAQASWITETDTQLGHN